MAEQEDILEGLEVCIEIQAILPARANVSPKERLLGHSKAFESLLSLTPAQDYYGSQIVDGRDPSEQWKAKKQTKEEKRAAKKAKLDPANQKSALDIMKERELKRKRELGMEDREEEQDGVEGDGKRQKVEEDDDAAEAKRRMKVEKRKEKRDKKKEKVAKLKAKREAKKAAKQDEDLDEASSEKRKTGKASPKGSAREDVEEDDDGGPAEAVDASEMNNLDMSGLADSDENEQATAGASVPSTAPSSPAADSPAFDISTNHSTTSSSSSIIPPSVADQPETAINTKPTSQPRKPKLDTTSATSKDTISGTSSPRLNLPDIDSEALQERLRARIEELRSKRKADGPEGKTPKSRQELLDQRRKKEEQRKAHKKELRRKAKEEEARKQEDRLRGSGSPLSTDIFSPRSPKPQDNNFSFSRLAFEDGTAADPSLSNLVDAKRRKGPMDPRTALTAAENKEKRLSGYDAEKRADIAEKDSWLNAKKRAHGERVRDDTSLLKKALKRKEKQKGKSESEWKERQQNVVKGKEMKQKKRETNLAKRKEEKGGKGKKGKGGGAKGKPKGRPGFEGRFKA